MPAIKISPLSPRTTQTAAELVAMREGYQQPEINLAIILLARLLGQQVARQVDSKTISEAKES